jgi:predicted nucleic-acid-binding protein
VTGLDTNLVLRFLLQDDPVQSRQANIVFEHQLSKTNLGYLSLPTVLEIVWVLGGKINKTKAEINQYLELLLRAESLLIQNEQQVFEAAFALSNGAGEFEDVLIAALNTWAGCSYTLTFDRKASRLANFRAII